MDRWADEQIRSERNRARTIVGCVWSLDGTAVQTDIYAIIQSYNITCVSEGGSGGLVSDKRCKKRISVLKRTRRTETVDEVKKTLCTE